MMMDIVWRMFIVLVSGSVGQCHHDFPSLEFDSQASAEGMTCYFCVNVSSNYMCNRFAIDVPCSTDLTVCHNSHVMDDQGNTLSVSKKCATEEMCSSQVGCHQMAGSANHTVCVACCDLAYCNEDVPHNGSTAIFHRSRTAAFSSGSRTFLPDGQSPVFFIISWAITTVITSL